jgi:hypothetical protein
LLGNSFDPFRSVCFCVFQNQTMMQFKITILAALIAATPAFAFTNGSLVPSYICNPHNDGLPKSFGQLLQFTREQTTKVAFSANGV